MLLHYREYGELSQEGSPLVFLHGLFGSSANWGRIAKAFADDHYCLVPDLRNHGRSFHSQEVAYDAQAADVLRLLDHLQLERASIIGHSMGGKVAMQLALRAPERIERLVVVDMAPRRYTHSFATILSAMQLIDLDTLQSRADADSFLSAYIDASGVRAYLLQNLVRVDDRWQWRLNIEALADNIDAIMDFQVETGQTYIGPALFIHGEHSEYIDELGRQAISRYFPGSRLVEISGAGHWVYADKPDLFIREVQQFLLQ